MPACSCLLLTRYTALSTSCWPRTLGRADDGTRWGWCPCRRREGLHPSQAAGQGPSQAPARLYGKVVLSRCSHCCGSCEPWSAPEGSLLLPPDPLSPSAESCSGLKPLPPLLVWRWHSGRVRGLLALVTMSPDHVKEADCCHPRPPELETT